MTLDIVERRRRRMAWSMAMYPIVQELRRTGMSQRLIALVLNEQGYRTFTGAMLNQQVISRLISGSDVNIQAGGS